MKIHCRSVELYVHTVLTEGGRIWVCNKHKMFLVVKEDVKSEKQSQYLFSLWYAEGLLFPLGSACVSN